MTKGAKRTVLLIGLAGAAYLVWKMVQAAKANPYASSSYFNPQTNSPYQAYYPALFAGDSTLITAASVL